MTDADLITRINAEWGPGGAAHGPGQSIAARLQMSL